MLVLDLSEYKVVTKKSVKKLTCRRERDSKPVDIYRDSITALKSTYGGGILETPDFLSPGLTNRPLISYSAVLSTHLDIFYSFPRIRAI